ncbi:MAG: hypothetical protein MI919_15505, partial [Holophagales bacterium]|nr:hypothetical protein [Holophagales bacterium]
MPLLALRPRNRGPRRAAFLVALLFLLAGITLLGVHLVGERERSAVAERFVAEVAPLPEVEVRTLEELAALSDRRTQESLARLRQGRAAKEEVLRALADGHAPEATARLAELVALRDELLASPVLIDQMIGVSL